MRFRTAITICVIAVLVCSAAVAQGAPDIEALGEEMEIAAEEGHFEEAFSNAATILEAKPDDPTELSAEEQYWVGNAHKIKMAQFLRLAKDGVDDREKTAFASGITDWLLNPDIRAIARGETVDLESYLIEGKVVIFEFFSEHSPASRQFGPAVEALARHRDDIALVKVNINRPDVEDVDLQSPVAQQYGIETLPHFKIYGPDGGLEAEGQKAQQMIATWLQKLQAQAQQQQQQQQQQQ